MLLCEAALQALTYVDAALFYCRNFLDTAAELEFAMQGF